MKHIIDAQRKILGRVASQAAHLLMGKSDPSFRRNKISDVEVVITNAGHIIVTGKKNKQKLYRRHSGYLGSLKEESFDKLFDRSPETVLKKAVAGMLPKNKLRPRMLKRLHIYKDSAL